LFLFIHTWWWSKETETCSVTNIINWFTYWFHLISIILLYNNQMLCDSTRTLMWYIHNRMHEIKITWENDDSFCLILLYCRGCIPATSSHRWWSIPVGHIGHCWTGKPEFTKCLIAILIWVRCDDIKNCPSIFVICDFIYFLLTVSS
jgi:hypothetical protein